MREDISLRFPSPLESYVWRGKKVYIKRDDLLHPLFNGNKARKFESLLYQPLEGRTLVSYGGNQSNAMFALSYIAKHKRCQFVYFTPPLSGYLQANIQGNLLYALQNGVRLEFVHGNLEALKHQALDFCTAQGGVFIPQGGSHAIAHMGIERLACELQRDVVGLKDLAILYVSGSGVSAGILAHFFPCVVSVGAAGGALYLAQMLQEAQAGTLEAILAPRAKIPFGKPNAELYAIYSEWLELGVEFDLIYDCLGWLCLYEHMERFAHRDIVFIHSGGLLGNHTQKQRYLRLQS
ncbi:pyridoxal-phosphate dependent enzyme [Helicobacter sp. 12S02634-8]|uniref:pyridoxal-phosphate dependent enzyme n=1 Tax=Helicobacter sp. 12S02634-8 TaxID=1476199 RepID=UPI00117A7D5C|nr:pyridoxal-phosphate dependent enzyme [Helicobacter sp. 12S02634-8]